MRAPSASPGDATVAFTQVHRLLRSSLEHAQDVIVVGLAVILFVLYLRDHHMPVDVMVETSIVAIALFVITFGILLRLGDLRVRRSRVGRADALYEGHASRLRRRPPSVTRGARPEPLSSPQ